MQKERNLHAFQTRPEDADADADENEERKI